MKTIEERTKEYAPDVLNPNYVIPAYIASKQQGAYIAGAIEQKAIDNTLIKELFEKAWSLADSMYQVGKDHLTSLTHQEFIKEMEDIAQALDK